MTVRPAFALPAVLLLGWLLLAVPGGLHGLEALAGLLALAAGVIVAAVWPAAHRRARQLALITDDLLGEAPGSGTGVAAPPGDADAGVSADENDAPAGAEVDPDAHGDGLTTLLELLTDSFDARRLLVWEVDPDAGRAAAAHVAGSPEIPRDLPAGGSPLLWSVRERSPLRIEPTPRWSLGAVVVAPVDDWRVLTVETAVGQPADPREVMEAARLLALFLRLHDRQSRAAAATGQLNRVIDFLRSLPGGAEDGAVADSVVDTAMELTGASGGVLAVWNGELDQGGTVVVRRGAGGGPAPGDTFGRGTGDLAHAARTTSTIRREPGATWPDLAGSDERWERPPPTHRTVIPLVDPDGSATGAVALWGRRRLDDGGVRLLEALGPLLALHLWQAEELERYRQRATVDALTGLPNRAALQERMAEERARFHRYRRPSAVLVVDLDHFKSVNDRWGHDTGDAVLRQVADVLRTAVREVDFAARFGGEELVVVLPETMLRAATDVAERVRVAIEAAPVEHDGQRIPVTASIGVSACPECVEDPAELFASADTALYASKEGGRNRVTAAPTAGAAAGG